MALFDLDLPLRGAVLPISLILNIELDQSLLKPFEDWIIFQIWTLKLLFFQLKALHGLGLCAHFVEVAVTIVEVGIDAIVLGSVFTLNQRKIHL